MISRVTDWRASDDALALASTSNEVNLSRSSHGTWPGHNTRKHSSMCIER
jgi:hypothetical protein